MSISERMKAFLKTIPNAKGKLGMSEGEFEKKAGLANGAISSWGDGISSGTLLKVMDTAPKLNIIWLISDKGDMLLSDEDKSGAKIRKITNQLQEDDVPYSKTISELVKVIVQHAETLNSQQKTIQMLTEKDVGGLTKNG